MSFTCERSQFENKWWLWNLVQKGSKTTIFLTQCQLILLGSFGYSFYFLKFLKFLHPLNWPLDFRNLFPVSKLNKIIGAEQMCQLSSICISRKIDIIRFQERRSLSEISSSWIIEIFGIFIFPGPRGERRSFFFCLSEPPGFCLHLFTGVLVIEPNWTIFSFFQTDRPVLPHYWSDFCGFRFLYRHEYKLFLVFMGEFYFCVEKLKMK